jgi:hypothetical protein
MVQRILRRLNITGLLWNLTGTREAAERPLMRFQKARKIWKNYLKKSIQSEIATRYVLVRIKSVRGAASYSAPSR